MIYIWKVFHESKSRLETNQLSSKKSSIFAAAIIKGDKSSADFKVIRESDCLYDWAEILKIIFKKFNICHS